MSTKNILQHKKILLGVSGGIAAYKSADLVRRLIEVGCDVRVVMTEGAQAFVTPMTFQALSGNPVHTSLLDPEAEAAMGHIEQARWADVILIAPASANTLARLAHGFADDLLSTLCLATDAPVALAPSMNRLMWSNAATVANIATLKNRGFTFFGPDSGDQACGETGTGRMMEPLDIRSALHDFVSTGNGKPSGHFPNSEVSTSTGNLPLKGTPVLITAGPTREPIDPVRYLSNRSSGKMGFAVAAAAAELGARVTLIAGPVHLDTPNHVRRIDVVSAADMHQSVMQHVDDNKIFISVAAVADYRVASIAEEKIKKSSADMSLRLERNADILSDVAALENGPFCVGFAAETNDVERYARDKLKRKKLDMIAANRVGQADNAVFNSDTNALDVYWVNQTPPVGDTSDTGEHARIDSASKESVARSLLDLIAVQYAAWKI
ncbi:MAG: bifunctional phosphopantothenoylcysteine decarboxylase/phosphopantothenate--cysteine ligase CoaBC [Granulosicoccus sp.]|nr:bifunctional phosphopantothenoylcysteine decarboxylase/phosphopantothenate--cysteine ligase CoaBC [Granulosicoccus sp.]